ncbi:eukaryotic translation initiation factor 3 subunit J [Podospora didyma]|uniref:Eukaryotic translation initiation factor 3 subunit J n=1 Tax=Podospora didyma TaxID=330526 RepID=A0AAE0U3G4_9PEZI|nr:eukaryotic translation initiation factor 3 subunit J [Podospora didyma]
MPGPSKRWEEEEEDSSSSAPDSPPVAPVRRGKFDDEEAEDSDVLESWDAAEDSEVEREKAKKAVADKAKAEAEAAANKKSKAQRIAERQAERARLMAESDESSDEDETEAQKRERLRRSEQESDLRHAEDLFGGIGISNSRKATTAANAVQINANDPTSTIDLASLPVFKPVGKTGFESLRTTLVPILLESSKKPQYTLFLQEFCKQLAKDLPSDQIKKIASTLTTLSNEKMKEEKAAEKGGKKSKAAKTKTTLAGISRGSAAVADTAVYEDTFADDDFM